jgi:hypothetical protein
VPGNTDTANKALEESRAYLETLTSIQIVPRLQSKIGPSDIIQRGLAAARMAAAADQADRLPWPCRSWQSARMPLNSCLVPVLNALTHTV